MSKFLKFTNAVININKIAYIEAMTDSYKIGIDTSPQFSGFSVYGTGFVNSTPNYITVCKKKDPVDYNILTKFINDIPDQIPVKLDDRTGRGN